uniref:B30.2/SPRY domain-containing protein n=1 Tax=Haplochromis burtoni TaxID=8153 RepID=A0A3Q2X2J5_HAPBU
MFNLYRFTEGSGSYSLWTQLLQENFHTQTSPGEKHHVNRSNKLQDILCETWTVGAFIPKTRADFLKYSREITLDPSTANTRLLLSAGNRKATLMLQHQSYANNPGRFTEYKQVLSKQSLTGRCYWEVEWRGRVVGVAVAYKSISRAGDSEQRIFGFNDKSWSLRCYTNSYIFWYNKVRTDVCGPPSSRIGVYMNHRAGVLSFYSVSDTMTLLHTVQTTFTEPLYAGLLTEEPVAALRLPACSIKKC